MRNLLVGAVVAGMVLGATAACSSSGSDGNGNGAIKIGIITPLTGGAADYGTAFWQGVQIAQDELNKAGGVLVDGKRHKIQATVCDDQFVPAKSTRCGHKLSNSLMIYTPASQSAFPLMGFNTKEKFIVMATSQTPAFTGQGNPLVVRSTYDLSRQLGQFTKQLHTWSQQSGTPLTSVAIMKVSSEFGTSWSDDFSKAWKDSGGKVTGTAAYDTNDTDFTSQLTSLLRKHPDAIALTTVCQNAALVVQQARDLGFTGTFINSVCPGGTDLTKFLKKGQLGKNVAAVKQNAFPKISVVAAFDQKYSARYHQLPTQDTPPFGYFGIKWLAKACEIAGTVNDAAKVHTALEPALKALSPNVLGITSYDPKTGNIKMTTYLASTKPDGELVNDLPGQN